MAMMPLSNFYKDSLGVNKSFLLGLFLILAFLGFLDASYLTILHYKNVLPPCSLAGGCETVLTSKYSVVFGLPVALYGSLFYLTLMVLIGLFWQMLPSTSLGKNSSLSERSEPKGFSGKIPGLLLALTTAGLAVGIYLVYLQAFVLHAFCQYCLTSELIDFLLFDCAWWLWRRMNKE